MREDNDHWKCGFNVEREGIYPRLLSHKDSDLSLIQIIISNIFKLGFLVEGSRDIPLYQWPLANVSKQCFAKKGNKIIKPIKTTHYVQVRKTYLKKSIFLRS